MAGLFDRLQSEIDRRERQEGVSALDLLELEPETRALVALVTRRGPLTAAEAAAESGLEAADVERLLDALEAKGFVRAEGVGAERRYRRFQGRRRGRDVPLGIWEALAEKIDE